jgi:hypothetical protein
MMLTGHLLLKATIRGGWIRPFTFIGRDTKFGSSSINDSTLLGLFLLNATENLLKPGRCGGEKDRLTQRGVEGGVSNAYECPAIFSDDKHCASITNLSSLAPRA